MGDWRVWVIGMLACAGVVFPLLLSRGQAVPTLTHHAHGPEVVCGLDPGLHGPVPAAQAATLASSSGGWFSDLFTNGGAYMPRSHCVVTAEGNPDWPWIIALVLLNVGVVAAYTRIYFFWRGSYFREEPRDRNAKLFDLSQIFLWCAVCGYLSTVVIFVWPGYRLVALCLVALNIWSWRFALNLDSFKVSFSANRFRRLAHTDSLTGLVNRARMTEAISEAVKLTQSHAGYGYSVMYLDFDRFKEVNDTLGHDAGDDLLKQIADRLSSRLRNGDPLDPKSDRGGMMVARMGGDEFVLLLGGVDDPATALRIGQRIMRRFHEPFVVSERSIHISASVGITTSRLSRGNGGEVLRDADLAMYTAKANGRDHCRLFEPAMLHLAEHRAVIRESLIGAVERNEFWLAYQPIVDLESGGLVGMEAMLRWRHASLGDVSAVEFIPVAEDCGLIRQLGDWVLKQACAQMHRWVETLGHDSPGFVSVNVSRVQFRDPDFAQRVLAIVDETGLDRSKVQLELTASSVATETTAISKHMNHLRAAGLRMALDDFGTGLSAIHCLSTLPLDTVKLDGSIIARVAGGQHAVAVLQAFISLAHDVGIDVIAECIETPAELSQLQGLGCDFGQGYYFGKPTPADDAWNYLRNPPKPGSRGRPTGAKPHLVSEEAA